MPKNSKPKLSFIDETTLIPNQTITLYIKDDTAFGLGVPADSGYLANDGPGSLTITNSDNGKRKTRPMTVNVGETAVWEHDDDEVIHTLFIEADAFGAAYRCRFARSKIKPSIEPIVEES